MAQKQLLLNPYLLVPYGIQWDHALIVISIAATYFKGWYNTGYQEEKRNSQKYKFCWYSGNFKGL